MQSLECVELLLFGLLPKISVPDIKNLGFSYCIIYKQNPLSSKLHLNLMLMITAVCCRIFKHTPCVHGSPRLIPGCTH